MPSNNASSNALRCARCSYEWMPRKDGPPKRCPKCRSIKWDDPNLRVVCLRCSHEWNSHNGTPKRCPSCGTHQWNVPPRSFNCKRCNYVWNAKGSKIPRKCPLCSSKDWSLDKAADELNSVRTALETEIAMEDQILKEYRRGSSCVDISISKGLPYSLVYEVVKRNNANININV